MDLNQLLFQHQVALMNAQHPSSCQGETGHFDLARHYAKKIRLTREALGVVHYRASCPI